MFANPQLGFVKNLSVKLTRNLLYRERDRERSEIKKIFSFALGHRVGKTRNGEENGAGLNMSSRIT